MHARIDWTDVGLVITNITNFGRTVVNDVPMKPLDAKLIKRREVILRLGELDGRLSLYREARKIARSTSKELQRIQSKLQCTKCNKNRHVKIQATFDEKRKFRLKFVLPKRDVLTKGDESLRRAVLTHALYNHFSHLSLVTDNTDE
uniref:AXP83.9_0 protein n=1 Tax=Fopius arisanus TaxID=64838 RepID=A0A0C9RIV3_9HYME